MVTGVVLTYCKVGKKEKSHGYSRSSLSALTNSLWHLFSFVTFACVQKLDSFACCLHSLCEFRPYTSTTKPSGNINTVIFQQTSRRGFGRLTADISPALRLYIEITMIWFDVLIFGFFTVLQLAGQIVGTNRRQGWLTVRYLALLIHPRSKLCESQQSKYGWVSTQWLDPAKSHLILANRNA